MSDRDIPSVPVTTLAGLTSLSDLLSELPVSDSISSVTSLNKSLLFHTLVADESKNLLSIRDDNLVKQLVNAIEQTSSDHIELKPQYAFNQLGTNINESPELLQGIYTFRPTVFNTPPSQRIQINNTLNRNSPVSGQQPQTRSSASITHQAQNEYQSAVPKSSVTTRHKAQLGVQQQASAGLVNNSNMQFVTNTDIKMESDIGQSATVTSNTPNLASHGNTVTLNNYHHMESTMQNPNLRQHAQIQQQPFFQQSHIHQHHIQHNAQQSLPQQNMQQATQQVQMPQTGHPQLMQQPIQQQLIQQPTNQQLVQPHQQHSQFNQLQQNMHQQHSHHIAQQVHSQQQILAQHVHQSQQPQVVTVQQQQHHNLVPAMLQQHNNSLQNALQKSASPSLQKQVISNSQQQVLAHNAALGKQLPGQNQSQQNAVNVCQKQEFVNQQLPQQLLQKPSQVLTQTHLPHQVQQPVEQEQVQQHKTIPRNNEYLEQQSMNFDLRGPSPAQGTVAPDSNQIGTPRQISQSQQLKLQEGAGGSTIHTSSSSTSICNKEEIGEAYKTQEFNDTNKPSPGSKTENATNVLTPKVCLNRLKIEDEKLMQESITKFVKKSPELAKKLGLTEVGSGINKVDGLQIVKDTIVDEKAMRSEVPQLEKNVFKHDDIFSVMKADDRRNASKRKLPVPVDIPPEEIFTKPKLRRVERILMPTAPKTSKEEVMKSQTYQQFMKNMEQIIELLDDTESPNFNSDDTDENVECISSKMLTVVSNDVAKLKAKGALDSIPKNKLTLLINYAMRNVYLARNYSAGPDVEEEFGGDDAMEKILNAIEACLLICNIYSTVKDLKFLQEDNISLIVKFVQFQFRETIFPSYDPVYTVKTMKKVDNRKKKPASSHNRSLQLLYSKAVELMKVFVTLFDKCIFVDTIVLALSTLAVEPFFVDGIETLQFVCLELVTTLFRKEQYVNMRSSILSDILASVDRLPCSKKNLRPFKLANNGGNIQMVTALVLQLIQCATVLPEALCDQPGRASKKSKNNEADDNANKPKFDKDIVVMEKYDTAVSIGGNFLTTFLSKCKSRSSETDFRPLFENFIHDLLATVNKPEWPAAELLLSLLGTLLVKYMSDKSIEQSIRLASLDYLGIVAARLRKDTVESRCKVQIMDQMIKCIKAEQEKEGDLPSKDSKIVLDPEEERTEFLQKILLDFLAVNAQEENLIWDYARHFYLAQWYRDIMQHRKRIADGEKGYASRKKTAKKKKRRGDESPESLSDEDDEKSDDTSVENMKTSSGCTDQELNLEIFRVLDERKKYLLGKIKPYSDVNCTSQHIKTYIDYNNAYLIAQYLASKRPFGQSFDKYLQKIILVVREPAIAIRTRAMKCLANIVEVDPLILKRKDMQMGVNQKFLDTAISVREAAVDLIGKYVLSSEELIDQYYEMLSTRILDTGVSVRKRVIKILRDICIEYPDFDKIPEICVKMIRRVHDEEGIQKLVTEVFMRMWFSPCTDNDRVSVQRKITQIIDVVNTAHDTGTTWLDGLLSNIFAPKENNARLNADGSAGEPVKKNTEPPADVVLSCQQLADGLVERLIMLEETDNSRMLGCITTMYLLAKVRPQLLVRHAITIEPYLNIKCHSAIAPKFISLVAEILEQVVPLMEHPSESFLADLEEHLMVLVVSLNQTVVHNCLSCLGGVVNKITKNYKLIRDCFSRFYKTIANSRDHLVNNPNIPVEHIYQPLFRRSLYTVGILTRFFDFKSPQVYGQDEADGLPATICEEVFDCLMYFMNCSNFDIRKQALVSIGFFCVQNDEHLTRPALKDFYRELLTSPIVEAYVKTLCMRNILMYLNDSELVMHNKEKDWITQAQTEDLKEMNDVMSGMASRIIQLYLTEILNCFLHADSNVRLWAVRVVQIVLRQGLVHPVRMVPYLICLSTDEKTDVAHLADSLLKDIDKTYSGFVNMKVQAGLHLSFVLQEILQMRRDNRIIRGFTIKEDQPVAMNDFLYTLLRHTKPQRRALVQTITKQFDDQKTTLRQMLFLADNLAYFPYVVQDEPLYLIHQIDVMISVTGTNLLANFKEGIKPIEATADNPLDDDDDEEDKDNIFSRLPDDTTDLQRCIIAAQGCMLLLFLKQHLKDMYGITDGKVSRYSPSEPQKIYEKAISRKQVPKFNPKPTIDEIKKEHIVRVDISEEEKKDLVEKYLEFKQLMLKLDPEDSDSQDEEKQKLNNAVPVTPKTPSTNVNTNGSSEKPDQENSGHVNNINNSLTTATPVIPVKDVPVTPSTRTSKSAPKGASTRKQPARSKRKRRKIVSSDEEDSDYSGSDYA